MSEKFDVKSALEVIKAKSKNDYDINKEATKQLVMNAPTASLDWLLEAAVRVNQPELVKSLLAAGANPNAVVGKRGWHWGGVKVAKALLEAGIDKDGARGSWIYWAAEGGMKDLVQLLVEHGAQTNLPCESDNTPLVAAARAGKAEVIRILLKSGVDPNHVPPSRRIPLIEAADEGKLEAVRVLIEGGANVNAKIANGETALMKAAHRASPEMVRLLLKAGADVNAVQHKPDLNALSGVVFGRGADRVEIIKLLANAGINVSLGAPYVLIHAMDGTLGVKGDPEVVKAVIDAGVNVNAVGHWGTALHHAAYLNRPEFVQLLLDAGADTSIRAPREPKGPLLTPLEVAIEQKSKKVIPLLEAAASGAKPPATGAKAKSKKSQKVPSVSESWTWFEAWLKEHDPGIKLGKGATDKDFQSFEKKLDVSLPDDFKESYRLHNGAKGSFIPYDHDAGIGYDFLSLDQIQKEWLTQKRLLDGGEFADQSSSPSRGVRNDWWHPQWIPFAVPGNGDALCLDLAPARGGAVGQVISFDHESPRREVVAASFTEWLAKTANEIESLAD